MFCHNRSLKCAKADLTSNTNQLQLSWYNSYEYQDNLKVKPKSIHQIFHRTEHWTVPCLKEPSVHSSPFLKNKVYTAGRGARTRSARHGQNLISYMETK